MEVKTKYGKEVLGCLVLKKGKYRVSCHEKTLCDCQIVELISKLKAQNKELVQAVNEAFFQLNKDDKKNDSSNRYSAWRALQEVLAKIKSEDENA